MADCIKTVFFDWDYTLAYTKTPKNTIGERLAWMFKDAGLPYSQKEIEGALAQYDADIARGKVKKVNNPQTRRDIAGLYKHLFNSLGHPDHSWALYERLYGTYSNLPTFLFEDSRPTLKKLGERGFKLGIISNHSRTARTGIEAMVGDLVPAQHIIISEEIGVHKPAKTIYRKAAARLRTPPSLCMLIGDNPTVDAIGAVNNGGFAQGVWLDRKNNGGDRKLPANVQRITSLPQLPLILDC